MRRNEERTDISGRLSYHESLGKEGHKENNEVGGTPRETMTLMEERLERRLLRFTNHGTTERMQECMFR